MQYRLKGKLLPIREDEKVEEGELIVEIINVKEYEKRRTKNGDLGESVLFHSNTCARYCKADILKNCISGTFVIPQKNNLIGESISFRYYMTADRFVFVDESGEVKKMLNHITEVQIMEKTYIAHFLFEFMEYLIKDDVLYLQQYEEKMTVMEEAIVEGKMEAFNTKILHIRKELLKLYAYYQQMADIAEILQGNANHMFTEEDCRLFNLFSDRVDRLYDHTQMLKEYSLQVREMYQSQIDIRQNQIMKVLTVVTTIFMPLTLIVGWYGMNFNNMPELKSSIGYGIVIVVSIIITIVEILYFKIKKWF